MLVVHHVMSYPRATVEAESSNRGRWPPPFRLVFRLPVALSAKSASPPTVFISAAPLCCHRNAALVLSRLEGSELFSEDC